MNERRIGSLVGPRSLTPSWYMTIHRTYKDRGFVQIHQYILRKAFEKIMHVFSIVSSFILHWILGNPVIMVLKIEK